MSNRYAMILNGKVENICLWDGDTNKWRPPDGFICILLPNDLGVGVGWQYDGINWSPPKEEDLETE